MGSSRPRPGRVVVSIEGRVARAGIPWLCDRVHRLLEGCEGDLVICDVTGLAETDAVVVEALARLQLTAARLGGRMFVRHAGRELLGLVAFMGLAGVIAAELPLELAGQAEEREQALGVEEERDPADLAARELEDLD